MTARLAARWRTINRRQSLPASWRSRDLRDSFQSTVRAPAEVEARLDIWDTARRLLSEYGKAAEAECDARASYHRMQGDKPIAEHWRKLKSNVAVLRLR